MLCSTGVAYTYSFDTNGRTSRDSTVKFIGNIAPPMQSAASSALSVAAAKQVNTAAKPKSSTGDATSKNENVNDSGYETSTEKNEI